MSRALRLDDDLVAHAEAEGRLSKRSPPKQVEYWADLGRRLAEMLSPMDLVALTQGIVRIRVDPLDTGPIDPAEVFADVDRQREQGGSKAVLTQAPFYYEACARQPGLLDRVSADGQRQTGYFREGQFVVQS